MSTKVNGFVVTLETDITQQQAEAIRSALMQIRGVIDVQAGAGGYQEVIARNRVNHMWQTKLIELVQDPKAWQPRME